MRVLITRPEADAGRLVEALKARGHTALVEPLLEIQPVQSEAPDLAGVQALLFTSANGLRALAALTSERDLPVFTVGDASAEAARAEGFRAVASAGGDVEDLARLIKARLDPAAGPLFHGAGATLAGDLKGLLDADGFAVRRAVLYNAKTVEAFSDGARQALRDGSVDAVLLFSPRTAETFAELVEMQGLTEALRGCAAGCLSAAVARKVEHLPWAGVRVARQPSGEALLAELDAVDRGGR